MRRSAGLGYPDEGVGTAAGRDPLTGTVGSLPEDGRRRSKSSQAHERTKVTRPRDARAELIHTA
jgi:hypothetical protein